MKYTKKEIEEILLEQDLKVNLTKEITINLPKYYMENIINNIWNNGQESLNSFILMNDQDCLSCKELLIKIDEVKSYNLVDDFSVYYSDGKLVAYTSKINKDFLKINIIKLLDRTKKDLIDDFHTTCKILKHNEIDEIIKKLKREQKLKRIL